VLISKWCINFLGMLMFAGSGQRPHVYASLAIPEHFDSTYLEWTRGSCPEFAAGIEKTCRASGFSSVVFPRWTQKIIHFHIRVVHQAVLRSRDAAASTFRPCSSEGANGSENSAARTFSMPNTLFIHTQTCEPYTTANVRLTLRIFIQYRHPELDSITPMVIRSSFATWQFQRYRQKLCFKDLREDEFVDKMANVMNNSAEMRSTYMAYSESNDDHEAGMRKIHRMFNDE
jgi:hypothetical protein